MICKIEDRIFLLELDANTTLKFKISAIATQGAQDYSPNCDVCVNLGSDDVRII